MIKNVFLGAFVGMILIMSAFVGSGIGHILNGSFGQLVKELAKLTGG